MTRFEPGAVGAWSGATGRTSLRFGTKRGQREAAERREREQAEAMEREHARQRDQIRARLQERRP